MAYDSTLYRLPDPETTPKGPGFVSVGLQLNKPGLLHDLNMGATVGVEYAGSYYTIEVTIPELFPHETLDYFPMLGLLNGGFTNFYIKIPGIDIPRSGVWDVSTPYKIAKTEITLGDKDNELVIPDWGGRGGDIQSGDFIKLDVSHKIYQVAYTKIVGTTKTIGLNVPLLEKEKLPVAGLEPNNIMFRVRATQLTLPKLTAKGTYEGFTIALRENIK